MAVLAPGIGAEMVGHSVGQLIPVHSFVGADKEAYSAMAVWHHVLPEVALFGVGPAPANHLVRLCSELRKKVVLLVRKCLNGIQICKIQVVSRVGRIGDEVYSTSQGLKCDRPSRDGNAIG